MITLHRTEESDLDYVLGAEHSPENRVYVTQWPRERHLAALTDPDIAHWIVKADKRVGYVILAGLQDPNETIELRRIVITEKGLGYGKAAIQKVKQQAFEKYQANRLWLDVKEHNHRAQSLYRAAEFVLEGTLRQCLKIENGHYESLLIMSILREEYRGFRLRSTHTTSLNPHDFAEPTWLYKRSVAQTTSWLSEVETNSRSITIKHRELKSLSPLQQ